MHAAAHLNSRSSSSTKIHKNTPAGQTPSKTTMSAFEDPSIKSAVGELEAAEAFFSNDDNAFDDPLRTRDQSSP